MYFVGFCISCSHEDLKVKPKKYSPYAKQTQAARFLAVLIFLHGGGISREFVGGTQTCFNSRSFRIGRATAERGKNAHALGNSRGALCGVGRFGQGGFCIQINEFTQVLIQCHLNIWHDHPSSFQKIFLAFLNMFSSRKQRVPFPIIFYYCRQQTALIEKLQLNQ